MHIVASRSWSWIAAAEKALELGSPLPSEAVPANRFFGEEKLSVKALRKTSDERQIVMREVRSPLSSGSTP